MPSGRRHIDAILLVSSQIRSTRSFFLFSHSKKEGNLQTPLEVKRNIFRSGLSVAWSGHTVIFFIGFEMNEMRQRDGEECFINFSKEETAV